MDQRIIFLPLLIVSQIIIGAWWYQQPESFMWLGAAILLINLASAKWLGSTRIDWWKFALLPSVLMISGLSYALMISVPSLALGVIGVSVFGSIIYWRLVFLYAFKQGSFRPFSLERSSTYLSLIAIFFSAAAIFGFKTFLDYPDWQLFGVSLLMSAALVTQWLWFEKAEQHLNWIYGAILMLGLAEFYIALSFLPINFHLLGFMLAVMWYGLSSLLSRQISGQLNLARARFILIVTILVSLAVLLTARWF